MEQLQIYIKGQKKLKHNTTTKYVKLFILILVNCAAFAPSRLSLGH